MIIANCIQNSIEWFAIKAGIPSAGGFEKIVTSKGEPSKSQTDYMLQLAGEFLIGRQEEGYTNYHMTRGLEVEIEARQYFELVHGVEVQQVGFVYKDERKNVGCSPDGLILAHETGLEVKSPMLRTHIKYLLDGKLPTEYVPQVQGCMYVTGFKSWHFLSYFPGMAALDIIVQRNDDFCCKLENELNKFSKQLSETIEKLKQL